MKSSIFTVVLLTIGGFSAPICAQQQDLQEVMNAVTALSARENELLTKKDAAGIASLFTSDGLVGNVRQNQTQNLVAAPSLKASMHSFVVRIALRQHVPLRTCVENPQYRFQHMTGRDRLASSTPIGNMLLRKMLPNALPLFVRQPNHSSFIADRQQSAILR